MWNPIKSRREKIREYEDLKERVRIQDELDSCPIHCSMCGKRIDGQIGIIDNLIKPLVRSGAFRQLREPRFYCNSICASKYYHENEPIESPDEDTETIIGRRVHLKHAPDAVGTVILGVRWDRTGDISNYEVMVRNDVMEPPIEESEKEPAPKPDIERLAQVAHDSYYDREGGKNPMTPAVKEAWERTIRAVLEAGEPEKEGDRGDEFNKEFKELQKVVSQSKEFLDVADEILICLRKPRVHCAHRDGLCTKEICSGVGWSKCPYILESQPPEEGPGTCPKCNNDDHWRWTGSSYVCEYPGCEDREIEPPDEKPEKEGKWVPVENPAKLIKYRCSVCNYPKAIKQSKCPRCGASMEEDR